ncbi:MAG: thiamine diphosphokinase [Candidatus Cloacimonetes bacterium]|nr:thiamine diphosphokinase [Candidatus Cloacimonadota bacterium]MCF7813506.1 thiamine diphosphokinase [Candidatus Cloacimonadota bacterium]MCF7868571.1 thiamine diphosphokinase [Candidatus Cloacimonadota bacterium]MCF7883359.1 thiamine diphosphokinase [Candidatus Cloacimonadota bacterium]
MKKEKVISIIGNGEKPEEKLKEIILQSDVIIAADGGANHCGELDIKPDYIIGDLDSIFPENKHKFCNAKIIRIEEQQTSDLEKTLNFASTLSPDLIRLFSIFGRRSDHTLYSLKKLWVAENNLGIELYDNFGYWKIYRSGQYVFKGEIGETVSFFSPGKVTKFESFGFEFPIKFGDYVNGFYSLSNTFQQKEVKIKFTSGKVLIYRMLHNEERFD